MNKEAVESKLPLTTDQYKTLRTHIKASNSKHISRNLLIISIQAHSVIRIQDVLRLTVNHVYDQGVIRDKFWLSQKKTYHNKLTAIYDAVVDDLKRVIKDYNLLVPNYFKNPSRPLFPSQLTDSNNEPKQLSYAAYHKFLAKTFKEIGLDPKLFGSSSIRSMIPLQHYLDTGNIKECQWLFGHRSARTTEIYIDKIIQVRAVEIMKLKQIRD